MVLLLVKLLLFLSFYPNCLTATIRTRPVRIDNFIFFLMWLCNSLLFLEIKLSRSYYQAEQIGKPYCKLQLLFVATGERLLWVESCLPGLHLILQILKLKGPKSSHNLLYIIYRLSVISQNSERLALRQTKKGIRNGPFFYSQVD